MPVSSKYPDWFARAAEAHIRSFVARMTGDDDAKRIYAPDVMLSDCESLLRDLAAWRAAQEQTTCQ